MPMDLPPGARTRFEEWRFVIYLVIGFAVAIGGTLWYVSALQAKLVRSTTLKHATFYSLALADFRTLYTSEVVLTARKSGMNVTHDYVGKERAIPLPATLSMLLGKKMAEHANGAEARLYSPYPFPWRVSEGALRDQFAQDAWRALRRTPTAAYSRIENYQGRPTLRYATADIMRPACVNCHNNHPASPKRDWKAGDVRGVLEVNLPLDSAISEVEANTRSLSFLLLGLALAGIVGIGMVIHKLRREIAVRALAEKAAELANQAKSLFLANMSHEIRTPLNAVLGFSQILSRDTTLNDDHRRTIQIIERSGHHLLSLINNVLDLSKIEAGAMTLQTVDFDLGDMLQSLDTMFRLRATQKGLTWQIDNRCGEQCPVNGDVGKLRQVLINLLGNALKFTDHGEICLRATPQGDGHVRFEVSDTGPGLTPEQQRRIFAPFQQEASTADKGGTGLGLAIAKSHVELLGGVLAVDSQAGQGSRFHFTIPLAPPTAAIVTAIDERNHIKRLAPGYQVDALVVDDIDENREVLARILGDIGATVRLANNGVEALERLREKVADIVFMDIRMPEMNGEEALQRMQAEFPKKIICVAISASSLMHEINYYLGLGFDQYLTKPFHLHEVYDCLSRLLKVRFEYAHEDTSLAASAAIGAGEFAELRIPLDLHTRLMHAAERNRITELKQLLNDLDKCGPDYQRLAKHLRHLLANIDIPGITTVLQEVGHV